jgi:SAM-dependent methyltransferase
MEALNYAKRMVGFNSSRYWLARENAAFAASMPSGSLMLDAGCGPSPYRDLFRHTRYESADFDKGYSDPTYVCDLSRIPVEEARFDFVVFNQVLEHLPEPKLVLLELRRVLKPGGMMIYTGPLFWEEHQQPYDFYRYTQFGLRYLLETSGFQIQRVDWLEGYIGTVANQLNSAARYLPIRPRDLSDGLMGYLLAPLFLILRAVFLLCSVLFNRLDTVKKFKGRGYPANYVVIVTRPLSC